MGRWGFDLHLVTYRCFVVTAWAVGRGLWAVGCGPFGSDPENRNNYVVSPSGELWGALGSSGQLWGALGSSGELWGALGSSGELWGLGLPGGWLVVRF